MFQIPQKLYDEKFQKPQKLLDEKLQKPQKHFDGYDRVVGAAITPLKPPEV